MKHKKHNYQLSTLIIESRTCAYTAEVRIYYIYLVTNRDNQLQHRMGIWPRCCYIVTLSYCILSLGWRLRLPLSITTGRRFQLHSVTTSATTSSLRISPISRISDSPVQSLSRRRLRLLNENNKNVLPIITHTYMIRIPHHSLIPDDSPKKR